MKTIEVLITRSGETSVQTRGFAGASCQAASQFLEQALGDRTRETLTGEHYQTATQSQLTQRSAG